MAARIKLRNKVLLGTGVVLALYAASLRVFDPRMELTPQTVESAAEGASGYLVRKLDADGRFEYAIHLDGLPLKEEYNVLRHAGTVYGLSLYYELTGDAPSYEAILRAARYLLRRHVRPVVQHPELQAVFSLPGEEIRGTNAQAKLGGSALGLIALIKARELDVDAVSLAVLREVGGFLLFMQEENGHFRSIYEETGQFVAGFQSVFYPGEAILALTLLHEADSDPRWLDAALRGIAYLERSRQGMRIGQLPIDHWLMIASEAALRHYSAAQAPPISRAQIVNHALAIGTKMIREQWRISLLPSMQGSFVSDGEITSSSARLEGLVALYNLLPMDHHDRPRILESIEAGLGFVLRAQVQSGAGQGGFTRSFRKRLGFSREIRDANRRQAEIRIDYVQHALSALVGYQEIRRR